MNSCTIVYKPGLEERGKALCQLLDKLGDESYLLRPWQFLKRRANKRAMKIAEANHADAIDWDAMAITFEDTDGKVEIEPINETDRWCTRYFYAKIGNRAVRVQALPEHDNGCRLWRVMVDDCEVGAIDRLEDLSAFLVKLPGRSDGAKTKVDIELSDRVDGSGMYYGWAHWGDTSVRLDVMPPRPQFRPDFRMDGYQADPTRYVIFADGEEVGRIQATRENLIPALAKLLMDGDL